MTSIALSIAGSDPSGGAGIQADLKTFAAHGVFGATVITALTAQNTQGVFGVQSIAPDFVRAQAKAVLDDLDVRAIKVGMLADAEIIGVVADLLRKHPDIPVVLDPVMVAAGGEALLDPSAKDALKDELVPLATLVTPNVFEAALLAGAEASAAPKASTDVIVAWAHEVKSMGAPGVLVKGGRRAAPGASNDVLVTDESAAWLETERVAIDSPHGSGCTLSSAIAAHLSQGANLSDAVRSAKAYVTRALKRALHHRIGRGSRPLLHAEP